MRRDLHKRGRNCAREGVLMGAACGVGLGGVAGAQSSLVFADGRLTPISDAATVQNTIRVANGPVVSAVRVVVRVLHPQAADLDLVLVHNGAYVKLSSGNGASSDYFPTRFRDDAVPRAAE